MALSNVYLVTDRINPVPTKDVDRLEKEIGSLPLGYREFMQRCGKNGELCDEIRVREPRQIIKNVTTDRRDYSFDRITDYRKPAVLKKEDFDELWLVATSVDGDRFLYFPRLKGVLFNVWRNADVISRHSSGFTDIARLTKGGTVRHPFPYFEPEARHRGLESFGFETRLGTTKVAEWIEKYWADARLAPRRVRMPKKAYGDAVYIFVKKLGAVITVHREDEDSIWGNIVYDKGHRKEIVTFVRALDKEFPGEALF